MDNTTYPGSETDNNDGYDHCDFLSTTSNQCDFVDQWVNLTVEKEVMRGAKLREEKLKSYPQLLQCDVLNIDFVKSPCLEDGPLYRDSSPGRKKGKTIPCSPRSNSPLQRCYQDSPRTIYSRPDTSNSRCATRCPMRIAELAVPTKRQCIDTWRTKCDVLPACMVERLRQHVMDEKPIVQISDAITCFQRRKPKSLKSINKRSKKGNRELKQNNDRNAEITKLCAAFADKIAVKLLRPQILQLDPELEKLSKVVADEIAKIIQNRKKHNLNNDSYRKIHADISDKIAVWIATILEDSSYKLLEEDLRVKKQSEGEIKDDKIITLIGRMQYQGGRFSELEEEEGPVLDFIDGLVDNVMNICEPDVYDVSETTSKAGSGRDDRSNSIENNELDSSTLYTSVTEEDTIAKSNEIETLGSKTQISDPREIDHNIAEGTELNTNEQREIDKIFDKNNLDSEEIHNLDDNELAQDQLDNVLSGSLQPSPGNSELVNQIKEINDSQDSPLVDLAVSIPNTIGELDTKNPDQIEESEIEKVNDVVEVATEESPDEKNKKVKFSEIDLAHREPTGDLGLDNLQQNKQDRGEKVTGKDSTDTVKQDLVLAPPNDHLLSDADESWPEDIATPVIKSSASVSRSVTSLGNILEKDELLQISEDEIRSVIHWDTAQNKRDNDINGNKEDAQVNLHRAKDNNEIPKQKNDMDTFKTDSLGKNKSLRTPEDTHAILEDRKITSAPVHKEELVPKKTPLVQDENRVKHANLIKTQVHKINNDEYELWQQQTCPIVQNDESATNFIYEAVQHKIKSAYALPEAKFDYKVHPTTAPSWLRNDDGKGEPSEDSFRNRCKSKVKLHECEMRSWCKELDRIYSNLEMWNGWVETTCKNVLHLKQKREMNKLFTPNDRRKDAKVWYALKKNIDKDAVLWSKLNQRAYNRLKGYQDKAKYTVSEKTEIMHVKSNNSGVEGILKTLEDIDRKCLWIHRMIVSTEYCLACECKNNPRRNKC